MRPSAASDDARSDAEPSTQFAERRRVLPVADAAAAAVALLLRRARLGAVRRDLPSCRGTASRAPSAACSRAHGTRRSSRSVEPLATLVELGPGSGEKLATLLDRGGARRARLDRPPGRHLAARARRGQPHARRSSATITHRHAPGDVRERAWRRRRPRETRGRGRTLALFLGSNIGNFDPPGADAFLRSIRAALARGDALLIGADLVKPERDLLLGLRRSARRDGGVQPQPARPHQPRARADFDLDGFAHRAVWNAAASRVEMHLVSTRRQRVRIPDARSTSRSKRARRSGRRARTSTGPADSDHARAGRLQAAGAVDRRARHVRADARRGGLKPAVVLFDLRRQNAGVALSGAGAGDAAGLEGAAGVAVW